MAETIHTDLALFQREMQVEFIEKSAQASDLLNANSNGTITMTDNSVIGTAPEKGFFTNRNTVSRRDTTSTADRSLDGHVQDTRKGIVIDRKMNDDAQISALKKQGIDPTTYFRELGEAMAKDKMDDLLSTALFSLAGGIGKQATTINDQSANTMTTAFISDAKALFGDRRGRLMGAFMHSTPYNALLKELGATPNLVTSIGQGVIRDDALISHVGMPIFVTDDLGMTDSTGPDVFRTFLLVEGALSLQIDDTVPLEIFKQSDKENAVMSATGEYNVEIFSKGYSYTDAGVNPAAAALETHANWTLKSTDVKDSAGVFILTL